MAIDHMAMLYVTRSKSERIKKGSVTVVRYNVLLPVEIEWTAFSLPRLPSKT